jgi:hypothetical protein
MGPISCPETLVRNYRSTLCKTPEERRSQEINFLPLPGFKAGFLDIPDEIKRNHREMKMNLYRKDFILKGE